MPKKIISYGNYYKRLAESPNVFDGLREKGVTQEVIDRLVISFANIPIRWQSQMRETISEQTKRRKKVIDKIKSAARALEKDDELAVITLLDINDNPEPGTIQWSWNSKFSNRPTMSELLHGLAEDIENARPYFLSVPKRITLETFACMSVLYTLNQLDVFQGKPRRPLKETAEIVTALLRKKVNSNSLVHNKFLNEIVKKKVYWKE